MNQSKLPTNNYDEAFQI